MATFLSQFGHKQDQTGPCLLVPYSLFLTNKVVLGHAVRVPPHIFHAAAVEADEHAVVVAVDVAQVVSAPGGEVETLTARVPHPGALVLQVSSARPEHGVGTGNGCNVTSG